MLSPFRRFWDMQSEINRMVAEAFRGMPQIPATEAGWTPTVDVVTKDNDMIDISSSGQVVRVGAGDIRRVGRSSQGVRTMRVEDDATVVALAPAITQMDEE